jgi:hypothetical protein
MNPLNDARTWRDTVSHLVQAHDADPAALIGYTPTLEQVAFAHFDTHVALEIGGMRPPDGHAHPEQLPAGWSEARPESYRPFPPSPAAREDAFFTSPQTFPTPRHTGLPHTGECPGKFDHDGVGYDQAAAADLADWPAAVRRKRIEREESLNIEREEWLQELKHQSPAQLEEALRDYIRQYAAAARDRWLASPGRSVDFPHPVTASTARGGVMSCEPGTRLRTTTPGQSGRASAAGQARPGRSR